MARPSGGWASSATFERWWDRGQPRLKDDPRITISYSTEWAERQAQILLANALPPGAGFSLTRRWRKAVGGGVEPDGWACDVTDGRASAMGRGETAVAAAQRALESWREFVAGSRVDLPVALDEPIRDRPPQLNAPSAGKPVTGDDAGRRAV